MVVLVQQPPLLNSAKFLESLPNFYGKTDKIIKIFSLIDVMLLSSAAILQLVYVRMSWTYVMSRSRQTEFGRESTTETLIKAF